jgi:hypothetical protein
MLHVSVKRHFEKEYCAASCQVTQKKESDLFEDVCWAYDGKPWCTSATG